MRGVRPASPLRLIGHFALVALTPLGRCHPRAVLAVGGEDPVETGEVDTRLGDQRGEPGDEVQGLEDDMGGAVAIGGLQLVAHLSTGRSRQALFRYRRAADVAAQPFQLVPFIGLGRHAGVQGDLLPGRTAPLRVTVRSRLQRCAPLLLALTVGLLTPRLHAQPAPDGGVGEATPAPAAPRADAGTPAVGLPPAAPVNPDRIIEIRVEGNQRTEPEAIEQVLKNKVGSLFDPTLTDDDLKAIWGLHYFSDVELLVQRLPKGIVYVIRVTERPIIRSVKLSGNDELSKDDLKEAIEVRAFTILDRDALRRTAQKIQDKYVEKGFYLAEVHPRVDPIEGSPAVNVVFVVDEHAKVEVKRITFIGAHHLKPDQLKSVMLTKEASFLSFLTGEGTYREEMFQRDLAVLQAAYYDQGYINVKIDKPLVSISPDKRYLYITLKIDEGQRFRIGKLDFKGDLIFPKEKLREAMSTHAGDWFNRSALSKDIQAITDLYYDAYR